MPRYSIFDMYRNIEPTPINEQLIYLMQRGELVNLRLTELLSQFKYCRENNIKDETYLTLRKYLVKIKSEDIVKILEGI